MSSKDLLYIVISPSAAPVELDRYCGNSDAIRVAYIHNVSGSIINIFMRQDGLFVDQDGTQIAENTDDLLQYLLTVEFDYHVPIMPQTLSILKEAGWFEGRKTDICGLISKYKDTSKNLSFQQKSCPEIGSYLKNSSKMVNEYAFRAV